MAAGALVAADLIRNWFHETDVLMFGGGPTSAKLVDEPVGRVDPRSLGLSGDVLLRSKSDGGLYVQPLGVDDRPVVKLFDARVVRGISPGGRHVVALVGESWRIVRLCDLHAVADVRGGRPFFLDESRLLVVFEGEYCTREDAVIVDLETVRRLELAGPTDRIVAMGVIDGRAVGQRQERGDSGCRDVGVATVDLDHGVVRTITSEGAANIVSADVFSAK